MLSSYPRSQSYVALSFPPPLILSCVQCFSMHVLLWCVLLTSPWAFGDIIIFVSCVYDLHEPLSYGCWYKPVGTLQSSQPEGMSRIYVIHQPLGYWCRARPVGMLCIYVFHQPLTYRCWLWTVGQEFWNWPEPESRTKYWKKWFNLWNERRLVGSSSTEIAVCRRHKTNRIKIHQIKPDRTHE